MAKPSEVPATDGMSVVARCEKAQVSGTVGGTNVGGAPALTPVPQTPSRTHPLTRTPSESAMADATGPTSLYRYYDGSDILIYVGITGRGISRNAEHNRLAEWWPFVARQEVEHFPSRQAALRREKHLIVELRPPFNRQHNPDFPASRDLYRAFNASLDGTPVSREWRDVHPLFASLKRTLPLFQMPRICDDELVLRTQPAHAAIALGLEFRPKTPVWTPQRKAGQIREIARYGVVAVIRAKVDPQTPLMMAAEAKLRAVDLKGGATFRITNIQLVPFPAEVLELPNGVAS